MQMQKIINQILEGNFDYESGSLDFSCSKIEFAIQKGQSMRALSGFMARRGCSRRGPCFHRI